MRMLRHDIMHMLWQRIKRMWRQTTAEHNVRPCRIMQMAASRQEVQPRYSNSGGTVIV